MSIFLGKLVFVSTSSSSDSTAANAEKSITTENELYKRYHDHQHQSMVVIHNRDIHTLNTGKFSLIFFSVFLTVASSSGISVFSKQ